jgi:ABC-type branched-subunit amino acid transport system substrate-binding protein
MGLVARRRRARSALATLLAMGAAGCTSNAPSTESSVAVRTTTTVAIVTTTTPITRRATIVLVVPTTGPLEGLGTEAKEGLELALRHASEDGRIPADMNIRIKVLDEGARSLARAVDRSARDPDVIAIVAGLQPTTEATLVPVANRRKVELFTLSWGDGYEPSRVVRVGPERDTMMLAAARHITTARSDASSLLVLATGDGASATRTAFVRALTTPPISADATLINTQAPTDPTAIAATPLVVTGPGAAAFALYAKARPLPANGAPSIVIPTDPLGCGTRATGIADGTHCLSRGSWLGTSLRARTFVEDAAARSITPSWATAAAYDAGSLLVSGAGPIKQAKASPTTTTASEVRTKLLDMKSGSTVAAFAGVSGRLTPGVGFVEATQVLRAERSEWVLAPSVVNSQG